MIFPYFVATCLIKTGGFLFGKIAPMVERWIEAPRGIGSTPILPTLQEGSSAGKNSRLIRGWSWVQIPSFLLIMGVSYNW